ncbi:MAG TPA: hypothetical protein VMT85_06505 [Thermoanaerobaculia bacterium]|nr:hypothetical protein [Thermoanaerobaculia bacterium]
MPTESDSSWLRRWIPREADSVAVLGEPPCWVAEALPPSLALALDGSETNARTDVAVVSPRRGPHSDPQSDPQGGPTGTVALLDRAARLLSPRGRLLLVHPAGGNATAIEALECWLLEAGFVLRPASLGGAGDRLAADYDGYSIRPYRPGDEKEILELFRRSFHVERHLAHWSWKYEANPQGSRHISLARDPAGRLVGQYCAYPVRFHRSEGPRVVPSHPVHDSRLVQDSPVVHQVGDTMTAPEVRSVGRGPTSILARTSRHFYSAFCRGRVQFNYGFNTGNIQKFSIRFVGATKVEEVPFRRRDLERRPPRPRRRLLGRDRIVSSPTPDELDALWRRVHGDYGSLVVRDSQYVRWRYLDCPDQDYLLIGAERHGRLVGWSVFSRRADQLVWGDLLLDRSETPCLETLLSEAVRRLDPGGELRSVVGWFPPRPAWLDALLETSGFERRAEPQELGLMVVPFEDPSAPEHCASDFFYTYGDSDLF